MRKNDIEEDLTYVELMIQCYDKISVNMDRALKLGLDIQDDLILDNLAFQLLQGGEQLKADKLSKETREQFSEINWKEMYGNRNMYAHSYEKVNKQMLIRRARKASIYVEELEQVRFHLRRKLEEQEEKRVE